MKDSVTALGVLALVGGVSHVVPEQSLLAGKVRDVSGHEVTGFQSSSELTTGHENQLLATLIASLDVDVVTETPHDGAAM